MFDAKGEPVTWLITQGRYRVTEADDRILQQQHAALEWGGRDGLTDIFRLITVDDIPDSDGIFRVRIEWRGTPPERFWK